MVMKAVLLLSLILGFFITSGINTYYPDDVMTGVGQAAMEIVYESDPILASVAGNVIVYFIVVSALYLFLRSVVKTFGD